MPAQQHVRRAQAAAPPAAASGNTTQFYARRQRRDAAAAMPHQRAPGARERGARGNEARAFLRRPTRAHGTVSRRAFAVAALAAVVCACMVPLAAGNSLGAACDGAGTNDFVVSGSSHLSDASLDGCYYTGASATYANCDAMCADKGGTCDMIAAPKYTQLDCAHMAALQTGAAVAPNSGWIYDTTNTVNTCGWTQLSGIYYYVYVPTGTPTSPCTAASKGVQFGCRCSLAGPPVPTFSHATEVSGATVGQRSILMTITFSSAVTTMPASAVTVTHPTGDA